MVLFLRVLLFCGMVFEFELDVFAFWVIDRFKVYPAFDVLLKLNVLDFR